METKFISNWALTHGILECRREFVRHNDEEEGAYYYYAFGKLWYIGRHMVHDTLEDAKIKAEQMRLAEIERVKVDLTHLENLRF